MISIVGVGTAGAAIADKFASQEKNYRVYKIYNGAGKKKR